MYYKAKFFQINNRTTRPQVRIQKYLLLKNITMRQIVRINDSIENV